MAQWGKETSPSTQYSIDAKKVLQKTAFIT
jgi:hypothetical protein